MGNAPHYCRRAQNVSGSVRLRRRTRIVEACARVGGSGVHLHSEWRRLDWRRLPTCRRLRAARVDDRRPYRVVRRVRGPAAPRASRVARSPTGRVGDTGRGGARGWPCRSTWIRRAARRRPPTRWLRAPGARGQWVHILPHLSGGCCELDRPARGALAAGSRRLAVGHRDRGRPGRHARGALCVDHGHPHHVRRSSLSGIVTGAPRLRPSIGLDNSPARYDCSHRLSMEAAQCPRTRLPSSFPGRSTC